MTSPAFIIVGRVRKAHGIRGEVVVEPITDVPDAIFASGHRVFAGTASGDIAPNRAQLHVESSRPFSDGYLIAFAEVPDRNAAETWRGRYLLVPADELPQGLAIDVRRAPPLDKQTVLLQFDERTIASVDRETRVIVVTPPEGLIE